jgi:uncharacterized membrane protein YfcA
VRSLLANIRPALRTVIAVQTREQPRSKPTNVATPTNLLYNIVATPGALYRYWRQGQTGGTLALLLTAGTVPGVIAGSVIRVKLIPGPHVFDLVIAAVLVPLGAWLLLSRPPRNPPLQRPPETGCEWFPCSQGFRITN